MGRSSNRIFAPLAVLLALLGAGALAPRSDAARPGPGALDPSFGHGGRLLAETVGENADTEFGATAREANGDVVLEARVTGVDEEAVREVQMRTPGGALVPSFGDGGRVTIGGEERGAGIAVLPDGDIVVGATECGGTPGMAELLDPTGTKVTSFGNGGCAPPGITPTLVAVDPQGRILLAANAVYCPPCGKDVLSEWQVDIARLNPDGSLDKSFGETGNVGTHTTLGLPGSSSANPILMAGIGATAEGGVVLSAGSDLIRLEPDGSPDPGYGKNGVAPAPAGIKAMVVEADGSIAAVTSESQSGQTVAKLTPAGTPDPGFGTAGTLLLSPRIESRTETIAVAPAGGYLIGGSEAPDPQCRACEKTSFVERITGAGAPDPSYGENGIAPLAPPRLDVPEAFTQRALAVGPDGSAIVVGSDYESDGLALALTASGTPEAAFGEGGALVEHRDQEAQLEPTGLTLAPGGGLTLLNRRFGAPGIITGFEARFTADGKQLPGPTGAAAVGTPSHGTIVPVGSRGVATWDGPGRSHVLGSVTASGGSIKGYGKNGRAKFPKELSAEGVAPAPGGGVLVYGALEHKVMAAFRIGADGQPLQRFGDDGLVTLGVHGARSIAYGGLVEADGAVVLTGEANGHFVAVRLLPDGRLDPHYGRGGRVRGLPGGSAAGGLIAPSGDGVVIDALKVVESRYVSAGLVRLGSHGRLDRSFGTHGFVRSVSERDPLALFTGGGRVVLVNDPLFEKGHKGGGVELRSYKPDGSVDRAFGTHGVRFFGAGTDEEHVFTPAAAVQQADGKVVVAGTARDGDRGKAELLRFLVR